VKIGLAKHLLFNSPVRIQGRKLMKLFLKKANVLIAAIAMLAFTEPSKADDLVDCKDPAVQKMVVQGIEDWLLLQGLPKGPDYTIWMTTYRNGTSPITGALKRKLESMWNTEVTVCEANGPDGQPFLLTGFMKTESSSGIGGFVSGFGAGPGIATFGGFDENLLR